MRARTTGSLEWVGDPEAPKPTDHWRCRVWVQGTRPWIKLPSTIRYDQRAKAEAKAHELAAAARKGKVPPATPRGQPTPAVAAGVTLSAWGKQWFEERKSAGKKSTRPDESKWNTWVVPRLGKLAMATVTREDLEGWVEWIDRQVRRGELAWKTAHNAWGLLTVAFQTASAGKVKSLRVRRDNPTRDVEPPERGVEKAKVYLYPSEFLALVGCTSLDLAQRRAYAVTVYLDPRAGEVEALHWEDLDLEHGTAHVHRAADPDGGEIRETKGRAARRFAIEPNALPLLRAMRAERPLDATVFSPWPLHKDRAGQLRAALRTAGVTRSDLFADDATRKHITFHDLRATGITWRAIRGDEPMRIMHAAGHRDLSTTMVYVREAENVRAGFGEVFPALPSELLGAGAPLALSVSHGVSQEPSGNAKTASQQGGRVVRGEGFEPSARQTDMARRPSNTPTPDGGRHDFEGARGLSGGAGTFAGTVEDHLRAAMAAAVAAGDLDAAQAALDALARVSSAATVVDIDGARRRRAR